MGTWVTVHCKDQEDGERTISLGWDPHTAEAGEDTSIDWKIELCDVHMLLHYWNLRSLLADSKLDLDDS